LLLNFRTQIITVAYPIINTSYAAYLFQGVIDIGDEKELVIADGNFMICVIYFGSISVMALEIHHGLL
jgi:hypothetical protein